MKRLFLDAGVVATTGAEPKWNQLFLPGVFHRSDFPEGSITFDVAFFSRVIENWKREGARPLPVDYFHRGESGDDLPMEEKVAAGWIQDLQARPDGVWGLISWTTKARAFIEADELRYLSPTFSTDGLDRSNGQSQGPTLFGAALLNDPYLKELPRVAASAAPPTTRQPQQEKQMEFMKKMAAALGLPDTATEDEVMAKFSEKCAAAPAKAPTEAGLVPPGGLDGNTAPDKLLPSGDNKPESMAMARLGKAEKAFELAQQENVKLAKRVEALEAEKLEGETIRLTEKLVSERRITPAQIPTVRELVGAIGLSKAADFYGKMPVQQIGELGVSGKTAPSTASESAEAYWAEVSKVQTEKKIGFADACRRVNASHPQLAKSISLSAPKGA